jgi:DNA repair protein RadC
MEQHGITTHLNTAERRTEMLTASPQPDDSRNQAREITLAYQPIRDEHGNVVDASMLILNTSRMAAATIGPWLMEESVEVFGVACLSSKHELLAWHVISRGTRTSATVSIRDVFASAFITPGTTGLIVVHNRPGGQTTPTPDDHGLSRRLLSAAQVLDIRVFDHLIVGDHCYYSFIEAEAKAEVLFGH